MIFVLVRRDSDAADLLWDNYASDRLVQPQEVGLRSSGGQEESRRKTEAERGKSFKVSWKMSKKVYCKDSCEAEKPILKQDLI